MRLDELLEGIAPAPKLPVAGLTLDSRAVAAGDAFVAIRGARGHGLEHADEAAERGARVVLWDPDEGREPGSAAAAIPCVAVTSLRDRLGGIADRFYGAPSSHLTVAGVTGTNGKTTCAWLLASAAGRLARRGAYLGTLGAGFPPEVAGGALTTPDVISLHRQLRALADAGATHVAMEVSSHALDQRRIDAVRLRVAAFSNLSRDHLDYHGTMDRYAEAKARLFRLPGLEHAVINVGDAAGARFAAALPAGVELTAVVVGGDAPSAARFVHVARVRAGDRGLDLDVRGHFGERRLRSPLIGAFNAENLAITLGVLAAFYLREYAQQGAFVSAVRIAVNNLAGVPSIVFGVFGVGFFIYFVGGTIDRLFFAEALPTPTFGTGGILWASLTLALLTIPVVIVATEEGLAAIPRGTREASLALGATKLETTLRVVLPAVMPSILTGLILAMARAAGEVAPLMITGVVKLAPALPIDTTWPFLHLDRKFMHLGFHIYDVGFQSPNVDAARPMVFTTTLLLLTIVVVLNLFAVAMRNRLRRRYATVAV